MKIHRDDIPALGMMACGALLILVIIAGIITKLVFHIA